VRGRGWLIPVALLLVIVAVVALTPNRPGRSPDHRSNSDAIDGTSALFSLAQALGHPTSMLGGSFSPPAGRGVLFVFSPDTEFSEDQVSQLDAWISDGGVLVYAATGGDQRLDLVYDIHREAALGAAGVGPGGALLGADLRTAAPILAGVSRVVGSDSSVADNDPPGSLNVNPSQVPLLRSSSGAHEVAAFVESRGSGRLVAISDPQVLANGNLGQADNGRLASDLISMAPAGAPVVFDEYHHGAGGDSPSLTDWVTTPWGAMLGLALLVVYAGLLLRGRSFGPMVSLAPTRDRSSAEYTEAVGTLLRRARARATTLAVLGEATRRSLAARVGMSRGSSAEQLDRLLAERAPELAQELIESEAQPRAGGQSEASLLEAARRLHSLAYPSAQTK
jgi:hypothetical protein